MLGERHLPAKVFAAMLRGMLSAPTADAPSSAAVGDAAAASAKPAPSSPAEIDAPPSAAAPKGKGAKGRGKAAKKQEPAVEWDAPATMHINSPTGTSDQQKCTGQYDLVAGVTPNGHPLWRHTRGDRWLYHGSDECWYVGDDDEEEMGFDCNQGYIRYA